MRRPRLSFVVNYRLLCQFFEFQGQGQGQVPEQNYTQRNVRHQIYYIRNTSSLPVFRQEHDYLNLSISYYRQVLKAYNSRVSTFMKLKKNQSDYDAVSCMFESSSPNIHLDILLLVLLLHIWLYIDGMAYGRHFNINLTNPADHNTLNLDATDIDSHSFINRVI